MITTGGGEPLGEDDGFNLDELSEAAVPVRKLTEKDFDRIKLDRLMDFVSKKYSYSHDAQAEKRVSIIEGQISKNYSDEQISQLFARSEESDWTENKLFFVALLTVIDKIIHPR